MTVTEAARLVQVEGVRAVHDIPLPPGRGALFNAAVQNIYRIRPLDGLRGVLTLVEFG